MAQPSGSNNPVLQLLITAKDSASGILTNLKTQLAAVAVAIGSAFSIKEAATFEKALDSVRARADETGPALEKLISDVKEVAQTLGPEFGYSATEAVLGIKELIAAGFTATESMDALKGTLALAAMEEISVAQAAILISDAIAQFGLTAADATQVADILAASAGAVAATAVDMAEALKYTGNAASSAGLSLTETSAVLDVLAKAGQRGSEAGTGLSSVLSILANPAHAATQALFEMGATSTELSDVLDFLGARGLNAAETIALFGEQGGRVINTLLAQGGTAAIADFADQITNSGKSAADTAKIMQDNLLGAFDRFWESLKRVGTELATPKLEPFANGLDTLTQALNTFASNSKIQAFQQAVADGFSAIYTAARDFANQIDWAGVSTVIGNAFATIKSAADSALTSLQSIVASLTGTLPGAASLAQTASDGLKLAWEGLGSAASIVAGGLDKIAQSLSGPITVGSDLAQQAMAGLTGTTEAARTAYDTLNSALKAGKVSQEQVTAAWERLQTVMASAQTEIDAAQAAYNAVVAAQKAGAATQEQVNVAWERLQTVMGSAQSKIDSAKLAYEGLNLQFSTGAGIADAVAVAHDRLNSTIESARQSIEKITSAVDGQTQGFQALWGALQSEAPAFLKTTFDSLATAAGDLLAGINALAQEGAKFIAGFITNADLSPVRDLFNAVADAARKLTTTIVEAFPQAEKAGATFADSFTIAWSGVVGILAAVVAGTLKVVESIGRATFEVGKYFDRYSEAEINKIEANLNGLSDTAGEFAAVAARSFESSGAAMDRMRERSTQAAEQQKLFKEASEGSAVAQQKLADAAVRQATAQGDAEAKARALALALKLQQAEMERLAAADLSSTDAKNKHAAATQKLWDLQEQFGEAVKGLTGEQFENVKATDGMADALIGLNEKMETGGATLTEYVGKTKGAIPTLEEMRLTMERTRAELVRVEEAQKSGNLTATATKSITEQVAEARKAASDGLQVYRAAIERNVAAEELAIKTSERKRQANEAVAQSGQALIDASIKLAEIEGNEAKVATLLAEKKQQQAESAKQVAAEYLKEANAAQRVADALRLQYEALLKADPTNAAAIQQAKEAADASNAEAIAKKATAIESAAKIPVMEAEAEQAAIMAGAIGELTRLYQDQTREHQRGADASERYVETQLQEIDGSIRVAQAKGDEAEVTRLQAEQQQALIDQANVIAANRQQEAVDAQNAVEAKKLELAADGELSKADQQQIADLQAVADEKKDAAQQARNHASALQAEADAAKALPTVLEDSAQRTKRMAEEADKAIKAGAENAKAAGSIVSSFYNSAISVLSSLSEGAVAEFKRLRGEIVPTGDELDVVRQRVEQTEQALGRMGTGGGSRFAVFLGQITRDAVTAQKAFIDQATAAERLTEQLNAVGNGGSAAGGAIEYLIRQSEGATEQFKLLNEQRLNQLRSAIDSANAKLREMQEETQSARERLAELNAEILEAQGQDQKANLLRQQLDYQQQLAEIEKQRQDAELMGNRELIALLNEQESKLSQLNRLKIANINAEVDSSNDAIKTANTVRNAWQAVGDTVDAVNQKAKGMDFSRAVTQSSQLRTNFNDLNALL